MPSLTVSALLASRRPTSAPGAPQLELIRKLRGGILPNNMPPAALLRLIKTRFKEAGVQFIDIKLSG